MARIRCFGSPRKICGAAGPKCVNDDIICPGIWFDAAGLEPLPKAIELNLAGCGNCVDLNIDDGELIVTSLQ